MTSAMELARIGREEQMKVFRAYEAGKEVVVKSHQQNRGYTCKLDKRAEKKPHAVLVGFDRNTMFLDAAGQCDDELVQKMLDEGMDPNITNADGLTALHQCAIENSLKVASVLVSNGARTNVKDNDWWTPLHAAAACGHWRVVNYLIANGADLTAVNSDGDLPIDIAEGEKVAEILETEMTQQGIDEEKREIARKGAQGELLAQIQAVIARHGDINEPDKQGVTPLHVAACNGWLEVLDLLLANKAKLDVRDEDGNTPLHLAVFFLQHKAVEALGRAGASADIKNRHLETPVILTEDAIMIRMLKSMTTHQKIEAAGVDTEPRSRTSSVKRISQEQKKIIAKADTKREGSQIEVNYAELSFAGDSRKGAEGEDEDDPTSTIQYANIDFNKKTKAPAAGKAEPAVQALGPESGYSQPIKKNREPDAGETKVATPFGTVAVETSALATPAAPTAGPPSPAAPRGGAVVRHQSNSITKQGSLAAIAVEGGARTSDRPTEGSEPASGEKPAASEKTTAKDTAKAKGCCVIL